MADEDLFKLLVREIDARVAADQKVFAHVMTTSNHRPFTYPSGRIDIPSGLRARGAVKVCRLGNWQADAGGVEPNLVQGHTLFVFIADHTSHARGRADLPPENYHIPLIIYAPSLLPRKRSMSLPRKLMSVQRFSLFSTLATRRVFSGRTYSPKAGIISVP